MNIGDFVVVNPNTIIAYHLDTLVLLRLCVENETVERVQLEYSVASNVAYVITAIEGTGVDVNQAVLQRNMPARLRFVRLNIDDARVEAESVEEVTTFCWSYHLSMDGCLLYGISTLRDAPKLHVFDMTKKTWTAIELTGDLQRVCCSKHKSPPQISEQYLLHRLVAKLRLLFRPSVEKLLQLRRFLPS